MQENSLNQENLNILKSYEDKRLENIAWIKKLLTQNFQFVSRNIKGPIGYKTILSSNGGQKIKEIIHSNPILDTDLE